MTPDASTLLARNELDVAGLHRTDPVHNLTSVASSIRDAFSDRGPIQLGSGRKLAVIAVDGLGFTHAARTLRPDLLAPLTSEFPTTTIACMLTAITGQHAAAHGFIGVQYLDADGRRTVNCHSGEHAEPTSDVIARPTVTPSFPTVFTSVAGTGVATVAVPNELDLLPGDVRGRLFDGCATSWPPLPSSTDPVRLVSVFAEQLIAATSTPGPALIWSYLDLDSHIHRHGVDTSIDVATRGIDVLARRLNRAGTSVLLFSDHGLAVNRASAGVRAAWQLASAPEWSRLPPGGAGRIRWLYPHAGLDGTLRDLLRDRIADAVVTSPAGLAAMGLLPAGSIGLRRLGEIVLVACGPDVPTPDPDAAYEHGSMTADETLVPMAIWHAQR